MASIRDIVGNYRRYSAVAVFSIAASSFFEILDLTVPYAIGQVLEIIAGQSLDTPTQVLITFFANLSEMEITRNFSLAVLLGLIFLVTVVRSPIQPWLSVWFHWDISLRQRRDSTQNVIQKILTLPLEFYDENNPGRIAGRVSRGITNQTWTYPEIAGQLIPKLFRVLGIFVVIWFIQWPVALFFLVSFVLVLGLTLRTLKRLIQQEEKLDKYMENTESRTSEIITNIKTVKAFAKEETELKRQHQRINREAKFVISRIHKGYVNLITWQSTIVQFCLFSVLGFTLAETVGKQMSVGHFVTTFTLASMAYAELTPISNLAEVFARRYASMLRLHEFMQLPNGSDAVNLSWNDQDSIQSESSYQFTGKVELCNIKFGYDPQKPVLQDINLLIEPYQTVALVGRSGSGKSTLVKLLFRYFEPSSGRILMDGDDIRSLDVTRYRQRLAIVHQDVDIFNGTLLDNLMYGNLNATFEQVKKACEVARAEEFIAQMEHGYYTVVGERGVRLSGGQKQRVGIARALLVEPDVLIFDEATSSLDYESERSIQLAMRSILGTRTTIIIAHRLSTVREADKIVVLDNGRIIEAGTHDELLSHQGIYHRLHSLQETGAMRD